MQLGQGEQLEGKGALALLVCLQHLKLQQSTVKFSDPL